MLWENSKFPLTGNVQIENQSSSIRIILEKYPGTICKSTVAIVQEYKYLILALEWILYNLVYLHHSINEQLKPWVMWPQGWLVTERPETPFMSAPQTWNRVQYPQRNIIGHKQEYWLILVLNVKSYSDRLKL